MKSYYFTLEDVSHLITKDNRDKKLDMMICKIPDPKSYKDYMAIGGISIGEACCLDGYDSMKAIFKTNMFSISDTSDSKIYISLKYPSEDEERIYCKNTNIYLHDIEYLIPNGISTEGIFKTGSIIVLRDVSPDDYYNHFERIESRISSVKVFKNMKVESITIANDRLIIFVDSRYVP